MNDTICPHCGTVIIEENGQLTQGCEHYAADSECVKEAQTNTGVVRIDPICMSIRGYENGVDIDMPLRDMREPTQFTATAIINNQGHVDICMIAGDLTLSHAKEIKRQFKAMSMQSGEWRRPDGKQFFTK